MEARHRRRQRGIPRVVVIVAWVEPLEISLAQTLAVTIPKTKDQGEAHVDWDIETKEIDVGMTVPDGGHDAREMTGELVMVAAMAKEVTMVTTAITADEVAVAGEEDQEAGAEASSVMVRRGERSSGHCHSNK